MSAPGPVACAEILQRLRTLKGHLNGVEKMVQEGQDCESVLIQVSALSALLDRIRDYLLEEQLKVWLDNAATLPPEERTDRLHEVVRTWNKLARKK